jgi:hypothetical protein
VSVSAEVNELKSALVDFLNLAQEIRNQRERYEEMLAGLGTVGSPELSDIPKGPPRPGDKIGAIIVRVEKLRDELAGLEARQLEFEESLEAVLGHIKKPDERKIIRLRYIDGKSWNDIAKRFYAARGEKVTMTNRDSCKRLVQKIHGSALVHIVDVCEEEPTLRFWKTSSD